MVKDKAQTLNSEPTAVDKCSKEVEEILRKHNCHFETQWSMQPGQGGIPFVSVRIAIVPNA